MDYGDSIYDCEDILAVVVPNAFTHIQEIIQTKGVLRRVVASKGIVHSYDSNGRSRVQAQGLVYIVHQENNSQVRVKSHRS